jgi:hypothetical protein
LCGFGIWAIYPGGAYPSWMRTYAPPTLNATQILNRRPHTLCISLTL